MRSKEAAIGIAGQAVEHCDDCHGRRLGLSAAPVLPWRRAPTVFLWSTVPGCNGDAQRLAVGARKLDRGGAQPAGSARPSIARKPPYQSAQPVVAMLPTLADRVANVARRRVAGSAGSASGDKAGPMALSREIACHLRRRDRAGLFSGMASFIVAGSRWRRSPALMTPPWPAE